MTRLEAFRKYLKTRVYNESADFVQFHKDVALLRSAVPEINDMSDLQIDELYGDFSTAAYAAGWLSLDDWYIGQFREWLHGAPGDKFCDYYPPDWYIFLSPEYENTLEYSLIELRKAWLDLCREVGDAWRIPQLLDWINRQIQRLQ